MMFNAQTADGQEKGEFLIKVGASSQDVRLENKIWL